MQENTRLWHSRRVTGRDCFWVLAAGFGTLLGAQNAFAANQPLEDFFIQACGNAAGALAAQCANAPGFLLSGDSESSLNPSQSATNNDLALSRAKAVTKESQERLEEERKKKAGIPTGRSAGDTMELGGLSLFLNVAGERFNRDRTLDVDQEKGYEGWKAGFQFGGDYRIGDKMVVGALIGYDHSESRFDPDEPGVNFNPGGDEGGTKSDGVLLNVYSSYSLTDNLYIDGTVGIGYTDYTFDRNVIFQNTARNFTTDVSTKGKTHGFEYTASAGVGYDFYHNAFSYGPYVRLNFGRSRVSAYTEEDRNNSGLNMSIEADTTTSITSVLGVQASYAISQDWGVVVPQIRFEYEHEYRDDPRSIISSFAQDTGGATFAVTTDQPDRNYFNIGGSLLFVLPNGWMPFVDFEALASYKDLSRRRVTAGLRAEF
ncbi:MAG: autotransporter domain-containing protein [Alphaproteobacteria bacterium]|nr:autotransporter domain-containing protein [Alphaproteobacteria bacterium]